MPKKINVRTHKRTTKMGKVTNVRKHNRNVDFAKKTKILKGSKLLSSSLIGIGSIALIPITSGLSILGAFIGSGLSSAVFDVIAKVDLRSNIQKIKNPRKKNSFQNRFINLNKNVKNDDRKLTESDKKLKKILKDKSISEQKKFDERKKHNILVNKIYKKHELKLKKLDSDVKLEISREKKVFK